MNLNFYNIFYQVAINQNITLTAKRLNISQPSISRAISLLEYELGQQLFIRSKNGVKLTKNGEILFNYISHGMNWIKKGEMEISKAAAIDSTLTVGASQLTIKTILPQLLNKYETKYPNVNLILQTDSSLKILEDLKENLIDLAIIPDPINFDSTINTINLMSFDSILIGGSKYSFLEDVELHFEDLNKYPFITLSQGTAGRKWLDNAYASQGQIPYPTIEVQTSDIITPLVKNNLGLGIVADIFTKEELAKGTIIQLNLKEELPKRNFLLCYNKNRKQNEPCKMFFDLIQEVYL